MINSNIFMLTFLLMWLHTSVRGQEKHMICKTVEDVFALHGVEGSYHTPITTTRIHGAPGKAGVKGQKGDIGPPGVKGQRGSSGSAGLVDYGRIEAAERRMTERIEELEEKFMGKLTELRSALTDREQCAGIDFHNVCYYPFFNDSEVMNYNKAVRICRQFHGEPADILNSQQYNVLVEYIRSLFSSGYRDLWLGMKLNPTTKVVRLSNGNRASYGKYYPDAPYYTFSSLTQMMITVKKDPSDQIQGMRNARPASRKHGVLCQK